MDTYLILVQACLNKHIFSWTSLKRWDPFCLDICKNFFIPSLTQHILNYFSTGCFRISLYKLKFLTFCIKFSVDILQHWPNVTFDLDMTYGYITQYNCSFTACESWFIHSLARVVFKEPHMFYELTFCCQS